jgi:hypothetical protein
MNTVLQNNHEYSATKYNHEYSTVPVPFYVRANREAIFSTGAY